MHDRIAPVPPSDAVTVSCPARFWAKVRKSDGCWLWTAALTQKGYGRFAVRRANGSRWNTGAHRIAYELLVGPIPSGLTLDHLCRNPACVNPAHLEPVTCGENVLRGVSFSAENASKTHCKHGHPFDEVNTRHRPGGGRKCRACNRELCRAYYARHAAPGHE